MPSAALVSFDQAPANESVLTFKQVIINVLERLVKRPKRGAERRFWIKIKENQVQLNGTGKRRVGQKHHSGLKEELERAVGRYGEVVVGD